MLMKVEGEPNLVVDPDNVVHNTDRNGYLAFIAKRQAALDNKQRIENLETTVSGLSDKMDLILQLLKDKK